MMFKWAAAAMLALVVAAPGRAAADVITFDNVPEGTIAAAQFPGVVFTGASVLTQNSGLNSTYPPVSVPNVVYNISSAVISGVFTVPGVSSIGAFVTGRVSVTLTAFAGAVPVGSVSTGGANFTGAGTGLLPNIFLSLSGTDITSFAFTGADGTDNSFTLDNVTVEGAVVQVPVPGPLAGAGLIPLVGFGAAWALRRRRRKLAA